MRAAFGATLFLALLSSYFGISRLLYTLIFNLFIIFALIVIYAVVNARYNWKRDITTENTGFFPSSHESRQNARLRKPARQFPLASKVAWKAWEQSRENEALITNNDYLPSAEFQKLVNELVVYISRDFLLFWYRNITFDTVWISKCEQILHFCFAQLTIRTSRIDSVQFIVSKLVPIFIKHFQSFRQAEMLVRGGSKKSNIEHIHDEILLAKHYQRGKLHPALTQSPDVDIKQQYVYIRKRFKEIVPLLLPRSETSKALTSILVEIMTTCIIQPSVQTLSDPDYWNQTFEGFVDKFTKDFQDMPSFEADYFDDSELPSFDDFVRTIRDCDNLDDAEEIREKVLSELAIKNQELTNPHTEKERALKLQRYIKLLTKCQNMVEKRIWLLLVKERSDDEGDALDFDFILENPDFYRQFKLFVESRSRQDCLQFWRNCKAIQNLYAIPLNPASHDLTILASNLLQIWEKYLCKGAPYQIFIIPDSMLDDYFSIIKARKDQSVPIDDKALEILSSCMEIVYQNMLEEDYPRFLKSEKYSKAVKKFLYQDSNASDHIWDSEGMTSDDGSPKRKSKFLSDVFKKGRKKSIESERSSFDYPRKVEKTENLAREMSSALNDDAFGRNQEKMDQNDIKDSNVDSDIEQSPSFFKHLRRLSRDEMKIFSNKIFSTKEKRKSMPFLKRIARSRSPSKENKEPEADLLKPPLYPLSSNVSSISENDTEKLDFSNTRFQGEVGEFPPVNDVLPPMVPQPEKAVKLGQMIQNLKEEMLSIQKQYSESDHKMRYLYRGMWHEAIDLIKEKRRVELEELENIITPSSIKVSIAESLEVSEDGKEYSVYPIQVVRTNSEGKLSGWLVTRRYNQFLALHQVLKSKFPSFVSGVELPGKMINGIMKLRKQFMDSRRSSLENYLIKLLSNSAICKTPEFRQFLCKDILNLGHPDIINLLYGNAEQTKPSFLKNLFNTVDDSFEAMRRKILSSSPSSSNYMSPEMSMAGDSIERHDSNHSNSVLLGEQTSATSTLIDLFVELFELREKNNWLRRQAVVLFLQQFFGDTVERKTTEALKSFASQENAEYMIRTLRDSYWPNGVWSTFWPVRTEELKNRTLHQYREKLLHLARNNGAVLGRKNTLSGAMKWFRIFQNRRLNMHLLYTLLDEILNALFPEITPKA